MSDAIGSVHLGAAFETGINATAWSRMIAEIFGNSQEIQEQTYQGEAEANIDLGEATRAGARAKAQETRWNAGSGMVGAGVQGAVAGGAQIYSSYSQVELTKMGEQLDNVSALKSSLPPPADAALVQNPAAPPPATPVVSSPEADAFKKKFMQPQALSERAGLFENQSGNPEFYKKDAAAQFSAADREPLADVQKHIESAMSMRNNEIQSNVRGAQMAGEALGTFLKSGLSLGSTDSQIQQGEEQANQTMAENTKNFNKSQQQSTEQMSNLARQSWSQLRDIVQSVAQVSNRV